MKELKDRWDYTIIQVNSAGKSLNRNVLRDQGYEYDSATAGYIAESIEKELNETNTTNPGTYTVTKRNASKDYRFNVLLRPLNLGSDLGPNFGSLL